MLERAASKVADFTADFAAFDTVGTDVTKLHTVLNNIVAMFSEYSSTKFSVEPVDVVYPTGPSHPKFAGVTVM